MTNHKVLRLEEIDDGAARKVEVDGRLLALVRLGDSVYAIGDTCSHDAVSLSDGYVDAEECTIECERHGASFDLVSGAPTSLPAVKAVPTYDVAVIDGDIWVSITQISERLS